MFLNDIVKNKETELARLKAGLSLDALIGEFERRSGALPAPRDFVGAVSTKGGPDAIRIIAEVKKASPSKGVIRSDFDPQGIAEAYEANGAAAISVLTEKEYFQGSLEYLTLIKNNVSIPVLRKDFIIDEYQVYEARAAGADAMLLIAAILNEKKLSTLIRLIRRLGMAALVEVHDVVELKAALSAGARLIGINNRDLNTFKVDINTTRKLARLVPKDGIIVSESGIKTIDDILSLKGAGVSAFLIGTALMREKDVGKKLRSLCGGR